MKTRRLVSFLAVFCVIGTFHVAVHAQINQAPTTPAAQYFMNRQANPAVGGQSVVHTARNYRPTRQPLQVAGGKPFEHIQRQPTLSPYLGLDAAPESSTSLPNWHLFVQPEMQQRKSAETQARELMRARQQMRVASARHVVAETPPAGAPITGSSTQFMNVGGYFPGVR